MEPMNTHLLVNSCDSLVTSGKLIKSKRLCQTLDQSTVDAALSIFQKESSSQGPSNLTNKKVQLIEIQSESPSEEEGSIDSIKPSILPTESESLKEESDLENSQKSQIRLAPKKPLPPLPSSQAPLTRERALSEPQPPSLLVFERSNSKSYFDTSKPRGTVLPDFTSSQPTEEAKSKSPFSLKFKKERKNSASNLENQNHTEIEPSNKAKESSPLISEKSERKRTFSFGRKQENKVEAHSPEANVETVLPKALEDKVIGKLISIPLQSYDSRYLDKIQNLDDVKLGLESTQDFSLTFFNKKILQRHELIEAILKAKSNSRVNTPVDSLTEFLADLASDLNKLIESLRYCDPKADSALRRVFSVNKGIHLCAYPITSPDKNFFQKLHIEILANGFKVSRSSTAEVKWTFNQNVKQTTSIKIEYVIENDLHYAKIAQINWKQETIEEKRAFLETLEKLISTL